MKLAQIDTKLECIDTEQWRELLNFTHRGINRVRLSIHLMQGIEEVESNTAPGTATGRLDGARRMTECVKAHTNDDGLIIMTAPLSFMTSIQIL